MTSSTKRPVEPIARLRVLRRRHLPWMRRPSWFLRVQARAVETARITRLRIPARRASRRDDPRVVVSLTSFPARLERAWITIETMLRQDRAVDRVVLVLAEDEFPGRDLPRRIVRQQRRGLEILWTERNHRCFNKLLFTLAAYPDAMVVTVDDDALYEPWLVSRLVAYAEENPGVIVGHRGWEVQRDGDMLAPYIRWPKASLSTPTARVFLTGVGGVLYPPHTLPTDLLDDMTLAGELCPTNDDIWFWAVARTAGIPAHCLGSISFRALRCQGHMPKLETGNRLQGGNDVQFARVFDHFGFPLPG